MTALHGDKPTAWMASEDDVPRLLHPLLDRTYREDVRRRLLANIVVDEAGCWVWQKYCHPEGYGKISVKNRMVSCHRVARFIFAGSWPSHLELDHLCRNRACCNPDHLEPVTREENLRRGRAARPAATTCGQGHSLADAYVDPKGRRSCRECLRRANREYARRQQAAAPPRPPRPKMPSRAEHGTNSRYSLGCRCDSCRAAKAAYSRQYRARKRAST